jgi:hypothetical protein
MVRVARFELARPKTGDFKSPAATCYAILAFYYLVLAVGIEPTSTALQTAAMTTSAKPAFGVPYRYRSGTTAFTEQGAGHYTKDTIDWYRVRGSNPPV